MCRCEESPISAKNSFKSAAQSTRSLFGRRMFVFVVLFGVQPLNVFGIMFGCVWCLVFGPCYVVFGVRLRCCVLFGVRASQLSESSPDAWSSYIIVVDDDYL